MSLCFDFLILYCVDAQTNQVLEMGHIHRKRANLEGYCVIQKTIGVNLDDEIAGAIVHMYLL